MTDTNPFSRRDMVIGIGSAAVLLAIGTTASAQQSGDVKNARHLPPELVQAHLRMDPRDIASIPKDKAIITPLG